MSVPVYGYVVNNKARVALERALRNPRKRVMGVDWESKLTFGLEGGKGRSDAKGDSWQSLQIEGRVSLACDDPCTPSKNRTSVTAPIVVNKALNVSHFLAKCGNFAGIDGLCGNCAGRKIHRLGRIGSLFATLANTSSGLTHSCQFLKFYGVTRVQKIHSSRGSARRRRHRTRPRFSRGCFALP